MKTDTCRQAAQRRCTTEYCDQPNNNFGRSYGAKAQKTYSLVLGLLNRKYQGGRQRRELAAFQKQYRSIYGQDGCAAADRYAEDVAVSLVPPRGGAPLWVEAGG